MAATPTLSSLATFDDLDNGFFTRKVYVRMLHSWEARNPKRGNNLMGLELLLLDEKVFISAIRIERFEAALRPQGVYSIENFLVTNNKSNYKVSEHKFLIHFTDQTVLEEVKEPCNIAKEKFRFRSFEDFDTHADVNEHLYDALGHIVLITDEQSNLDSTKGRIGIHLQLKDGPIIRVTFWTGIARKFREALAKFSAAPRVLIATAINPRKIGGMLYLNSTSATRFFFDTDVEPSSNYLAWLNDNQNSGAVAAFPASEVTKLESVTLTELQAFLATKTPQRAGFICEAKIINILPDYGWNYVACTKCTCKLTRTATTLLCKNCNDPNAVGIIRYRVELLVQDNDGQTATFVLFDREATQLAGKKAADIMEPDEQGTVPQGLLDAIGKTLNFQIKVTEYNFSASRQTLTVSRILTKNNMGSSSSAATLYDDLDEVGSVVEVTNDKKKGRDLKDEEAIQADKNGKRIKYD